MARLLVMKSLLAALTTILLPACAGQPRQLITSCGSVRVPRSETGGVVCISVCDEDSGVNSCYGSQAPSGRADGQPVATGTGELVLAILNGTGEAQSPRFIAAGRNRLAGCSTGTE